MRQVWGNLRNFFKNEKIIFLLVIFCSIVSSIILFFSYGLIHDFTIRKRVGESESYELQIQYKGLAEAKSNREASYVDIQRNYNYLTFKDVKTLLSELDPEVYSNMDGISTKIVYDDENVIIDFDESGGIAASGIFFAELNYYYNAEKGYISIPSFLERLYNPYSPNCILIDGSGLTNEDFLDGNPKAVIGTTIFNDLYVKGRKKTPIGYNAQYEGEFNTVKEPKVSINGNTFNIIGVSDQNNIVFPISALSDDTVINTFFPDLLYIVYDVPVTHEQYTRVQNLINEKYPDVLTVREIEFKQKDKDYFRIMLLVSALISLIAFINIAIMFRYILMKRKKQIAIFKICGCTDLRLLSNFISEIMTLIIPSSLLGIALYFTSIKPGLLKYYIYLNESYSFRESLLLYSGYILVSVIILFIMVWRSISVMPASIIKEED